MPRWPVRTFEERFWAKVDRSDSDGCWLWTAAKTTFGYGVIGAESSRRLLSAHRVAYELLRGPIADGLELDHLCREPSCVNPIHLEPVTHAENVRRGEWSHRAAVARLARSHCPRGHPYDRMRSDKRGRECSICRRATDRARYARNNREAVLG